MVGVHPSYPTVAGQASARRCFGCFRRRQRHGIQQFAIALTHALVAWGNQGDPTATRRENPRSFGGRFSPQKKRPIYWKYLSTSGFETTKPIQHSLYQWIVNWWYEKYCSFPKLTPIPFYCNHLTCHRMSNVLKSQSYTWDLRWLDDRPAASRRHRVTKLLQHPLPSSRAHLHSKPGAWGYIVGSRNDSKQSGSKQKMTKRCGFDLWSWLSVLMTSFSKDEIGIHGFEFQGVLVKIHL